MDTRTQGGVEQPEKTNNPITMPSTLKLKPREHPNERRKYEGTMCDTMAETERRKFETDWICKRILSDTKKKCAINELELLAVVWGLELFSLFIYGKPFEIVNDHQAAEQLIKRKRSEKRTDQG